METQRAQSDRAAAAPDERHPVEETRRIWDLKADAWDERMGEGNAFQRVLAARLRRAGA